MFNMYDLERLHKYDGLEEGKEKSRQPLLGLLWSPFETVEDHEESGHNNSENR